MAFNGEGSWDWAPGPSGLQRIVSKSGTKNYQKFGYNHYNQGFLGGWKRCEVGSLILLMIWCTKKWMTRFKVMTEVNQFLCTCEFDEKEWKPHYFHGKFLSLLG